MTADDDCETEERSFFKLCEVFIACFFKKERVPSEAEGEAQVTRLIILSVSPLKKTPDSSFQSSFSFLLPFVF